MDNEQRQLAKNLGLSDKFLDILNPQSIKASSAKHLFDYEYMRKKRKEAKASRRRNRKK